jgi:hypothetical protein
VFLTMEGGETKRHILDKLREYGRPFIDVGLGVYQTAGGALGGVARVTTSTSAHPADPRCIPSLDEDNDNDYNRNIQIADLNMLNAALAVIKWKKLMGFYADLEQEFFSTYTIDGNHITNEDNQRRASTPCVTSSSSTSRRGWKTASYTSASSTRP